MGTDSWLLPTAIGVVALAAVYQFVPQFKKAVDGFFGQFGGGGTGNVTASCDQLCQNGACSTFSLYCKGTCAKCEAQKKVVTDCGTTCRAKGMIPGLTASNQCICKAPTSFPLGKVFPHPTLVGYGCYRQKCGAKEVSWCIKGSSAQIVAAWKRYACPSAKYAHAHAYAAPFENVTMA